MGFGVLFISILGGYLFIQRCHFTPDPAIVGAGLVREGGRSRAVEALTIVRS